MQLILDSESDLGLDKKMSALDEESLDEKLVYDDINDSKLCDLPSIDKELISECLHEKLIYDDNIDNGNITPNSNKENIQSQYNGVVEIDENKNTDIDSSGDSVSKETSVDGTKDDAVLCKEENRAFVSEENRINDENLDIILQKEAEILDDEECVEDLISLAAEIRESNEKLNEIDKLTNDDILNQDDNFTYATNNEENNSDENVNDMNIPQKNLAEIEALEILVKEKNVKEYGQQEEKNLNEILDKSQNETSLLEIDRDSNVNTISENDSVAVDKGDCLTSSEKQDVDDSLKGNDNSENRLVDNSKITLVADTSDKKDEEIFHQNLQEISKTLNQDLETASQHQTQKIEPKILDDETLMKEKKAQESIKHSINQSNNKQPTAQEMSTEFSLNEIEKPDIFVTKSTETNIVHEVNNETPVQQSKLDINAEEKDDNIKFNQDILVKKKPLQDTKATETFDILKNNNKSLDSNSKSNELVKTNDELEDNVMEIKPKEISVADNIFQTEESKQDDKSIDTGKPKEDFLSNSDMELDEPMEIDTTVSNNIILSSPIITDTKEISILAGAQENRVPKMSKLLNNLDILSDDDEDPLNVPDLPRSIIVSKKCVSEEDDDIMLIDEDQNAKNSENATDKSEPEKDSKIIKKTHELTTSDSKEITEDKELSNTFKNDSVSPSTDIPSIQTDLSEKTPEDNTDKIKTQKLLFSEKFLSTCKKNLADMSRNDLEEFCKLKIVESIVDRSSLSELKTKIKTMTHNFDEYKKKTMSLTKQNRDLQVVLKSVQEELKKRTGGPITPLKITRSVGMQILMTEPSRRKGVSGTIIPVSVTSGSSNNSTPNNRQLRNTNQSTRNQKTNSSQQIPVPRLVPANNLPSKTPITANSNNGKTSSPTPIPNGVKNSSAQKPAEKRGRASQSQSVTVDLTDDEPPSKVPARSPSVPPVRLVPPQNLMAAQRPQFGQQINSPRKVYIPISGPQGPSVRPGQTIMLKSVPAQGPRARAAAPGTVSRPQQNAVRLPRVSGGRHPAPLPDAMKQYQPPNWKALPPAPDLKLSKVENGIVISWKIEGYQEDSYEEIASYQLYAYQETNLPPSTTLWKKIGDVKALPLPMACTLTQFMAGYKYYFAVRAVDVRSRVGPFSLPGNIVLLSRT